MDIKENKIFSQSQKRIRHPWETARLRIIQKLLEPVLGFQATAGTILDVGCGDAYILRQLSGRWPSFKFLGVDSAMRPEFAETLKRSFDSSNNIHFYSGLSDIPTSETVDVSLLLDVLEHVEDDRALLKDVSLRLSKNGYVLITVPAFQCLYCGHDRWLGHFRRYREGDLLSRIQEAGLTPVKSGYFFSALLAPRMVHKTLELCGVLKHCQPTQGIGGWKYGQAFGSIGRSFLYCNACLDVKLSTFGIKLPGLSVFALCQK